MPDAVNPYVKVFELQLKKIAKLKGELENPKALMKQLGALVLGASIDSFKLQRLGPYHWEARYPQQPAPKLNMAGFIEDFNNGRGTPKPIRFIDRPALIDEGFRGGLVSSMTYRALDTTSFEVGTNKPYAAKQFYGGKTSIPITKQAKIGIRKWLYKKNGGYKKNAAPYADKVEPLLGMSTWKQKIIARPFVGIFQSLWNDILSAIEDHFSKHAGGA